MTTRRVAVVLADELIRRGLRDRGYVDVRRVAEMTGLSVPGARRVRDGVLSGSPTHTALIARLRADLNAETCAPRVRADALADEHMREEWPEPIGART